MERPRLCTSIAESGNLSIAGPKRQPPNTGQPCGHRRQCLSGSGAPDTYLAVGCSCGYQLAIARHGHGHHWG